MNQVSFHITFSSAYFIRIYPVEKRRAEEDLEREEPLAKRHKTKAIAMMLAQLINDTKVDITHVFALAKDELQRQRAVSPASTLMVHPPQVVPTPSSSASVPTPLLMTGEPPFYPPASFYSLSVTPPEPAQRPQAPPSPSISPDRLLICLDRLRNICVLCWVNGDPSHPVGQGCKNYDPDLFIKMARGTRYADDICYGCGIPRSVS